MSSTGKKFQTREAEQAVLALMGFVWLEWATTFTWILYDPEGAPVGSIFRDNITDKLWLTYHGNATNRYRRTQTNAMRFLEKQVLGMKGVK